MATQLDLTRPALRADPRSTTPEALLTEASRVSDGISDTLAPPDTHH